MTRKISLFILPVIVLTTLNFYNGFTTEFYNPISDLHDDFEHMIKEIDANPKQERWRQPTQKQKVKEKGKKVPSELSYIHDNQLQENHMFSDSWLLNRERFLEINATLIYRIEDAALVAAWPRGQRNKEKKPYPHAKMLLDWTDFCVEHLSKWWGMIRILGDDKPGMFPHVISILDNYIRRHLNNLSPSSSSTLSSQLPPKELKNTIVMVAFMPYKSQRIKGRFKFLNKTDKFKSRQLTSYSLAATILPLFNVGFSRLIVIGREDNGHEFTRQACEILNSILDENRNNYNNNDNYLTEKLMVVLNDDNNDKDNTIATIGYSSPSTESNFKPIMEIAHVKILHDEWMKGEIRPGRKRKDTSYNIPRGAIIGLQKALMGKLDSTKEQDDWLGRNYDLTYWKYIYLTEPDTILNLNHNLLPLIKKSLDDGISLFPHRLHPLPHETDLPTNNTFNRGQYLPNHPPFSNITTLDPFGDNYISCCDDGLSAPGKENWIIQHGPRSETVNEGCKGRWWECGFFEHDDSTVFNMTEVIQGHARLLAYRFMRLHNGIGISFGTNNQGRQCIPSKTICDEEGSNRNKSNDIPLYDT